MLYDSFLARSFQQRHRKPFIKRFLNLLAGLCLSAGIMYVLQIPTVAQTQQGRILRISNATIARGDTGNISLSYVALGDEAGVGLSINFDPSQLTFVSITPGAAVVNFIPTTSEAALGRLGFFAVRGIGQTFQPGINLLASVTFTAATDGDGNSTEVTFGNNPIPLQLVRPDGSSIPPELVQSENGIVTFTLVNPLPAITSLSPTSASQNGAGFSLTVNGSGFVSSSVVKFAGVDRSTSFVSPGQLTALITQADLATAGTKAVTVVNPTPGGGTSGAVNFTVTGGQGPQGLEGDVSPRGATNGAVDLVDYVQMGRFAAGLDQVSTGSEFQKADCSPRNTLGDGVVSLGDYVQAGRYAAALDPQTQAGGPSAPSSSISETSSVPNLRSVAQQTRTFRIPGTTITRGQNGTITIQYEGTGDEAGVGLSISFDTSQLTFVSISPAGGLGSFIPNTSRAAMGQIGFLAAAAVGQTLPAGRNSLVSVTFNAIPTGSGSSTQVTFGNNPIAVQVVRSDTTNVPPNQITIQNGTVTLQASLANVSAQLGGQAIGIQCAGVQGTFEGEDQANTAQIPRSYIGRGLVNFVLTVDKVTNTVQVSFQ